MGKQRRPPRKTPLVDHLTTPSDPSRHRTIEISEWSHIHTIANLAPLWAFRGQRDAAWSLETTLYRAALAIRHDLGEISDSERWMLYQFKRRAHHYLSNLPPDTDPLNWLAIMQHYGAPTRLLDFSHSIYVASFFACEKSTTTSAVWGINLLPLLWRTRDAFDETIDVINRRVVSQANQILLGETPSTQDILAVEPERMHERLAIQQGVFLFPSDVSAPFETNLASGLGIDLALFNNAPIESWKDAEIDGNTLIDLRTCKVLIPQHLFSEGLRDLHNMNIDSATLFPGLDGFARSLYYHFT
jgi:FRG domain